MLTVELAFGRTTSFHPGPTVSPLMSRTAALTSMGIIVWLASDVPAAVRRFG